MTRQGRPRQCFIKMSLVLIVLLSANARAYCSSLEGEVLSNGARLWVASRLPDLSGLAWIENDLFVAVHDAKNPEENDRPRMSLLQLPTSLDGILWRPLQLNWPKPQGKSSDLESIARIPGTRDLLLVESGDDGGAFRRIFLARFHQHQLQIVTFIEWPTPIQNVEGSAVGRIGGRLIFIYAERAQGQPSTQIRWADLELQPLRIGTFQEVTFISPDPTGPDARPVSALEVDSAGWLYVASAFDPGNDNGPFRSVMWRIGQVKLDGDDKPQLLLDTQPLRLGTLDGLKVESIAVREKVGGKVEIFVGMDEENYGGTMRLIPRLP